jgi:hypothetical protein
MAEDRGAFKTNPAKSRQILAFVTTRHHRCKQAAPAHQTFASVAHRSFSSDLSRTPAEAYGILEIA